MAIVDWHIEFRRLLLLVAVAALLPNSSGLGQIKLSPGSVPIGDNELNSPVAEPQVTIDEHSSNAVMRPTPLWVQQSSDPLVKLVYQTREAQRRRLLSTSEHTPWQIMHGMLALREEFLIRHNGEPISCLEWIKTGPTFENENWFEKTQIRVLTGRGGNNAYEMMTVGRGHPYNKPYAFEGHINQFVAIMSMSGVPLETQFQTPQGPVSMRDMLTYAKMTVNEKEEVSWTLWALSRYLPSDAEWTNAQGEKWSIERLVKIETGKSLQGAPCGGTHGLFALAHARNVYLRSGKPLVGVWLEAEQKIRRYIQTARYQQNPNGSLSSNYFRGREFKPNFDKRMASSGHLLEFLMMALPSQELNAPWVRRAIEATSNDLMANRKEFVSCSPLYHATSALSIYIDRVAAAAPKIAQGAPNTHTISNSQELKTVDASLSKPVIENSESVKTPVMESSGVDGNGAPKALTGPITTVPDLPERTSPQPTEPTSTKPTPTEPTPTEPTPTEPTPTEPTPTERTPTEPTPTEPTSTKPTPTKPTPTEPTPTEPTPTERTPTEPTPTEPTPTEPTPTEPTPTELASVVNLTIQAADRKGATASIVESGDSLAPGTLVIPFEPKALSSENVAAAVPKINSASKPSLKQTLTAETFTTTSFGPSTAVPAVPTPEELLARQAESEVIVTPGTSSIPMRSVSAPRSLPNDSDPPPDNRSNEKKRAGWKVTPPERRKVIVVGEKNFGE